MFDRCPLYPIRTTVTALLHRERDLVVHKPI